MRRLIAWATANPILTIPVALVPVCIAAIVYITMSGATLKEEATSKVQGQISRINRLMRTPVEVPSDDPNRPTASIAMCITQSAIDQRIRIRDEMGRVHRTIFSYAVERNRHGLNFPHEPMVRGLFPGHEPDPSMHFGAQKAYMRILASFTMRPEAGATTPRLGGGRPLSAATIRAEMAQIEEDFIKRRQAAGGLNAAMDPDETRELFDEKRQILLGLLHEHAKNIQMYVHSPRGEQQREGAMAHDTPFHVGEWVHGGDKPSLEQLWEGQLELWIQQDIVEAIAMTNQGAKNVLSAPVKRLVRVMVEPGYVGINSEGAVRGFDADRHVGDTTSDKFMRGTGSMAGGTRNRGPGHDMRVGTLGPVAHPAGVAAGGSPMTFNVPQNTPTHDDEELTAVPDGSIEHDYELSPTGRQSNSLYDVRHAVVTLIVDSKRIGQFLDNMSRVNFMTVLLVAISDVDEFEHLRGTPYGHFFYGPDDAVQVTLVIESLWLRRWTSGHWDRDEAKRLGEPFEVGLMPDTVRTLLELKPRKGEQPPQPANSEL